MKLIFPVPEKKRLCLKTKIPVLDIHENSAGLIALFYDITEHVETEKKRILLEKILDNFPTDILITKLNEQKNDLDIAFINDRALKNNINIDKSKINKLNDLWKHFPANLKDNLLKTILNVKEFPHYSEHFFEHPVTHKEKYYSETLYNPIKDYYFLLHQDITEQKEDANTINLLEKAINSATECLSIYELDPFRVIYLSNSFANIFGYDKDKVFKDYNFKIMNCVHPDYLEKEI